MGFSSSSPLQSQVCHGADGRTIRRRKHTWEVLAHDHFTWLDDDLSVIGRSTQRNGPVPYPPFSISKIRNFLVQNLVTSTCRKAMRALFLLLATDYKLATKNCHIDFVARIRNYNGDVNCSLNFKKHFNCCYLELVVTLPYTLSA